MVSDLPEIAQRYFKRAIAPGTPLRTTVELEMRGTFLLGDKSRYQTYAMTARQLLSPPSEFVWLPRMKSGPMRISGSDGLVAGTPWTRFWWMGLLPVANERASADMQRSAVFRSAMEGQRWSNANPEHVFRLQPFGGTMEADATFDGLTIPSVVRVGNHFKTDDFLPFFQVELIRARYL